MTHGRYYQHYLKCFFLIKKKKGVFKVLDFLNIFGGVTLFFRHLRSFTASQWITSRAAVMWTKRWPELALTVSPSWFTLQTETNKTTETNREQLSYVNNTLLGVLADHLQFSMTEKSKTEMQIDFTGIFMFVSALKSSKTFLKMLGQCVKQRYLMFYPLTEQKHPKDVNSMTGEPESKFFQHHFNDR